MINLSNNSAQQITLTNTELKKLKVANKVIGKLTTPSTPSQPKGKIAQVRDKAYHVSQTLYPVTNNVAKLMESSSALLNVPAFAIAATTTLLSPKTWLWSNNITQAVKAASDTNQSKEAEKFEVSLGEGKKLVAKDTKGKKNRYVGTKAGKTLAHGLAGIGKVALAVDAYNLGFQNVDTYLRATGQFIYSAAGEVPTYYNQIKPTFNNLNQTIIKSGNDICKKTASDIANMACSTTTPILGEKVCTTTAWETVEAANVACDTNTWGQYAAGATQIIKEKVTEFAKDGTINIAGRIAGIATTGYLTVKSHQKLHEISSTEAKTYFESAVRGTKMAAYGISMGLNGALTVAGIVGGPASQIELGNAFAKNVAIPFESNVAGPILRTIVTNPGYDAIAACTMGAVYTANKACNTWSSSKMSKLKSVSLGASSLLMGGAAIGLSYYKYMNGSSSEVNQNNNI